MVALWGGAARRYRDRIAMVAPLTGSRWWIAAVAIGIVSAISIIGGVTVVGPVRAGRYRSGNRWWRPAASPKEENHEQSEQSEQSDDESDESDET